VICRTDLKLLSFSDERSRCPYRLEFIGNGTENVTVTGSC